MTDSQRRTIIIDYPSLHTKLNHLYDIGELRHGRQIADAIPSKLDALLASLGRKYSGPKHQWRASLKDYSDRRLLLEEGRSAGVEIDAAVEGFAKAGFRRFVDPGRRKSGSLLIDVMRDFLEGRRPTELVIATADPGVVDIVDLLRPVGVLTGLICVFDPESTDQIRGVPDALIDLVDIAESLKIEMKAGFELKDDAEAALEEILSRANEGRWLSLEGAFDELKTTIEEQRSAATGEDGGAGSDASHEAVTAPSDLPAEDRGKQRYLKDALEEMNFQNWRLAPNGTGFFDVRALSTIADKASQLFNGGWQVDWLRHLAAAAMATRDNYWLGHEKFEFLLEAAREHDTDGNWEMPDAAMFSELYLTPSEDEDQALLNVARFVNERLNVSSTAVRLSELAQALPKTHPDVNAETGWANRLSFLELIKQANRRYAGDAWVLYTEVPPGYLGLRKHPRPVEEGGKPPVQTTTEPNESSARPTLRTAVPAFPSGDADRFLFRAAVLATVLTQTNVVNIVNGRNPFNIAAGDARDLSKETADVTGRAAFNFLLKSLTMSERVRKFREHELRLVLAIHEVSGKPEPDAEQLLGTQALLRIVSENLQKYLSDQSWSTSIGEEAQSYLGPSEEHEAKKRRDEKLDPELINAKYERFKPTETELTTRAGYESLQRMLEVAAEERKALLDEVLRGAGESLEQGDVLAEDDHDELRQRIAESLPAEEGLSLLELHQAVKSDFSELRLLHLARFLGQSDSMRKSPWVMFPSSASSSNTLPYSRRRSFPYARVLRVSSPQQVGPGLRGEREWFDFSWRFWTSLIEKKIAVSWIEAAHAMIRVERRWRLGGRG